MSIKAIIFDFDGTLVVSNEIKYNTYFRLFPEDIRVVEIIDTVLKSHFEKPRTDIFEILLSSFKAHDLQLGLHDIGAVARLSSMYNKITVEEVKECSEVTGASRVLRDLHSKHLLFLSSTTPDSSLKEIVSYRHWDAFFSGIFGYPNEKYSTIMNIRAQYCLQPDQIVVVGDGESDRLSAERAGCHYRFVAKDCKLDLLLNDLLQG